MPIDDNCSAVTLDDVKEAFGEGPGLPAQVLYSDERAQGDREMEDVRTYLNGRFWQDVHLEGLLWSQHVDARASWFWLSREAKGYYFPAWLQMAIEPHDWAGDVEETLQFWLCGGSGDSSSVMAVEDVVGTFTERQLELAARFLLCGAAGEPPGLAPDQLGRGLRILGRDA